MNKRIPSAVGLTLTLSGCTGFFATMNQMPVSDTVVRIENSAGNNRRVATSISTDPTRRLVIFNGAAAQTHNTDSAYICAEPPPDTALNVLSETSAAIQAAAKKADGVDDAKVGASLAESLKQVIVTLGTRTELVEIYRSATYSLCQLHMNGALNGTETATAFSAMTTSAIAAASNSVSKRAGQATEALASNQPPTKQSTAGTAVNLSGIQTPKTTETPVQPSGQ